MTCPGLLKWGGVPSTCAVGTVKELRAETLPGLKWTQRWSLVEGLCLRACLSQPPVSMVTRALRQELGPTPTPPQPTPAHPSPPHPCPWRGNVPLL